MTILTHTVVAGLIGSKIPNPFLAALAGFASHFVLDLLPHNDYLYLWKNEKAQNPYTTPISLFILSLTFLFLTYEFTLLSNFHFGNILIASLLGILPDAYTGLKVTLNLRPDFFDRFHNRVHHQLSWAERFFNDNHPHGPVSRARSLTENYHLLKDSHWAKKGWLLEMTLETFLLVFSLRSLFSSF